MARHNEIGNRGEEAAAEFLLSEGHEILERNYRNGKAEVDLISKDLKTIVFIEVKTRGTTLFGHPEEFVDRKKKRLMKQVAEAYMLKNHLDAEIRFDIISILHENGKMKIEHYKDAFFNLDNEEDDKYQ